MATTHHERAGKVICAAAIEWLDAPCDPLFEIVLWKRGLAAAYKLSGERSVSKSQGRSALSVKRPHPPRQTDFLRATKQNPIPPTAIRARKPGSGIGMTMLTLSNACHPPLES